MIEAPKEIWCDTGLYYDFKEDWSEGSWRNYYDNYGNANVKYIRADRIEELEAKLAKAVELANLVEEFSDRALWKVVKEVVLELKGEK